MKTVSSTTVGDDLTVLSGSVWKVHCSSPSGHPPRTGCWGRCRRRLCHPPLSAMTSPDHRFGRSTVLPPSGHPPRTVLPRRVGDGHPPRTGWCQRCRRRLCHPPLSAMKSPNHRFGRSTVLPRLGIHRVQVGVNAADENCAIRHCRRIHHTASFEGPLFFPSLISLCNYCPTPEGGCKSGHSNCSQHCSA